MPASIAAVLKRLVPQPAKQTAKEFLNLIDPLFVAGYRFRTGYDRPLPPRHLRARVGSASVGRFIDAGNACARALQEGARQAGKSFSDFDRILDFGCGCGRTLQSFSHSLGRFTGCDVDASAIQWMQNHYQQATFVTNQFEPPLPFADGTFDLVYSISIFTHLDENRQTRWLDEIHRILQNSGVALISVQGEHALRIFRSGVMSVSQSCLRRVRVRRDLQYEAMIYEPYEEMKERPADFPGIDDSYGLTFHADTYIRSQWSRGFEVIDILPGIVDSLQDLVVLRKNSFTRS